MRELMKPTPLHEIVGNTDIYLLDQIMKEKYRKSDTILDAGCGGGRNLFWFLKNEIDIYGVDNDATAINYIKSNYPNLDRKKFIVAEIDNLPFDINFFDHLISSAVLHFAKSTSHFKNMMKEMTRVLKPNGSLFIRMTSNIGIENKVRLVKNGVYDIPDSSTRFLLTPTLLNNLLVENNLSLAEPLKTVNVDNLRCMSTLVLIKN
ncbi:MAG: class I SAM-dependent methyltransferase [Ginsengibacter sp.]